MLREERHSESEFLERGLLFSPSDSKMPIRTSREGLEVRHRLPNTSLTFCTF